MTGLPVTALGAQGCPAQAMLPHRSGLCHAPAYLSLSRFLLQRARSGTGNGSACAKTR
ncbi:hypothetical protein ACLBXM_06280 [Xanthobacteraceae bacterium A53D]